MYTPASFRIDDLPTLHAFMRRYSFATVITCASDAQISHLPLLLDETRGNYGTLLGHFARANPHWQADHATVKSIAIFHGPHAYISPSWYPDGKLAVPTWNYTAVHATGTIRLLEEPNEAQAVVERLADTYESSRAAPWKNQLPGDLNRKMMNGIVVFEMPIQRIEGKFKLSQNRSDTDQQGAIAGLREAGDGESVELAEFASARLKQTPGNT